MPKDYITNEIFEKEFSLVRSEADLLRQEMREGFEQVNRNIGAMIEEFRDKVKVVLEGFQMEVEKVEMFRLENTDEHEKFNSRITGLEAKTINF